MSGCVYTTSTMLDSNFDVEKILSELSAVCPFRLLFVPLHSSPY